MPDLTPETPSIRFELPPIGKVVEVLIEILTPRLVTYLAGEQDTSVVKGWAKERGAPAPEVDARFRVARNIALLPREHDQPSVVQAWFIGLNPELDDNVPLRVLREQSVAIAGPEVMSAARAFIVNG